MLTNFLEQNYSNNWLHNLEVEQFRLGIPSWPRKNRLAYRSDLFPGIEAGDLIRFKLYHFDGKYWGEMITFPIGFCRDGWMHVFWDAYNFGLRPERITNLRIIGCKKVEFEKRDRESGGGGNIIRYPDFSR